jgi:DNA invertase Pin-like site-specific DNA recombinase
LLRDGAFLYQKVIFMRIGYARVSTQEQSLDLQKDALKKARCEKIVVDVASGKNEPRAGLEKVREVMRKGDVIVVWRLDRLGRSLRHLIDVMTELEGQRIGFQSLQEELNTTTSGGKLVFHIFGALAEFERNLIQNERKPDYGPLGRGAAKGDDPSV